MGKDTGELQHSSLNDPIEAGQPFQALLATIQTKRRVSAANSHSHQPDAVEHFAGVTCTSLSRAADSTDSDCRRKTKLQRAK